MAQTVVSDQDRSYLLLMETSAVHIWRAYSEFVYDSTSDRLDASAWLERDGSVVSGAISVNLDIYDSGVFIKTMTSNASNAAGFFSMSWNNSGLSVGKVYTAIANITNASGANFKTPSSFRINYNSLSRAEFTYYAAGDDLKVTSWLEIDSKIIASVSQINIEIRDGSLS